MAFMLACTRPTDPHRPQSPQSLGFTGLGLVFDPAAVLQILASVVLNTMDIMIF